MPTYSQAQIAYIWIQGGGSAQQAPLMSAIAMAESGGRSDVYNGICCYGLWQINANHGYSVAQMDDPVQNAREANTILQSQGLGAWCTYTNGAYRQFYNPNIQPDSNTAINATAGAAGNASQPTGAQTAAIQTCSWTGWFKPWDWADCAGRLGANAGENVASNILGQIMGSVLNPIIQWTAGGIGVLAGVLVLGGGVYLLVREARGTSGQGGGIGSKVAQAGGMLVPGVGEAEAAEMAGTSAMRVRAGGGANVRMSGYGRTSPQGEPLRSRTISYRNPRTGETHTATRQQVLRDQAWQYYNDPGRGKAGPG